MFVRFQSFPRYLTHVWCRRGLHRQLSALCSRPHPPSSPALPEQARRPQNGGTWPRTQGHLDTSVFPAHRGIRSYRLMLALCSPLPGLVTGTRFQLKSIVCLVLLWSSNTKGTLTSDLGRRSPLLPVHLTQSTDLMRSHTTYKNGTESSSHPDRLQLPAHDLCKKPKHAVLSGKACRSRGLEKSCSNGPQPWAGAMQVSTAPSLLCPSRTAQAPSPAEQFHGHRRCRGCCLLPSAGISGCRAGRS